MAEPKLGFFCVCSFTVTKWLFIEREFLRLKLGVSIKWRGASQGLFPSWEWKQDILFVKKIITLSCKEERDITCGGPPMAYSGPYHGFLEKLFCMLSFGLWPLYIVFICVKSFYWFGLSTHKIVKWLWSLLQGFFAFGQRLSRME